jgi:hypothetical protein
MLMGTTMTESYKEGSPGLARYEEAVSRELRVLLAGKNVSQKTVAHALGSMGIRETPKGLSAKLNAGTFSAAYYLALKDVINAL